MSNGHTEHLMARIRSVKPRLFASPSLARVSIPARFLFVGLFTEADDEGRLLDSPKRIAGNLFPHDDSVTPRKVKIWLDELHEVGSVERYTVEGIPYLWLPTFLLHQKVSNPTPSILPPPPEEIVNVSRAIQEHLGPEVEVEVEVDREEDVEEEQGTGKAQAPGPFEDFWNVYPRKDDKAKAKPAFDRAAKKVPAEEIIAGAIRYRDDPNREPEFTKLPTTWLNAGAWENGPLPARGNGKVDQLDAWVASKEAEHG